MFRSIAPRVSRPFALLSIVVVASVYTSGCASGSPSFSGPGRLEPSDPAATITVDNRRSTGVAVYTIVGDTRYRLGTVETLRSQTFKVPRVIALPSEMGLYVSSLSDGANYMTPSIGVGAGDSILFTVENATQFSTLLRR